MVPSQCVRMVAYTQSMTDCDWGTRSKCIRIISKQMNAHSHTHTRTINSIKINLNFKEYEWKCKLNAYNFCGVWVLLFSYCVCNTNFVYICRPRVIIYVLCRINNKNNHKTYTFQSHQNNSQVETLKNMEAINSVMYNCACKLQNQIKLNRNQRTIQWCFCFIRTFFSKLLAKWNYCLFLLLLLLLLYHDLCVQIVGLNFISFGL